MAELSFYQALTAAVGDFLANGYDSVERLAYWTKVIRDAASRSIVPEYVLERELDRFLSATYERMVGKGQILNYHPGIARFTLEKVRPQLHASLERSRVASRNLVKLNRKKMMEDLDQRFTGWATSIPAGGIRDANRREIKEGIKKSLARLPFEERRVHVDQGHKFIANLNQILAHDGGAIAAIWHSHYRQAGYNYREDHKERDSHVYLVRGSWAIERGLIRTSGALYTDEQTMPGEEIFCRCFYQYIYSLQDIPPDLLSEKGRVELKAMKVMLGV